MSVDEVLDVVERVLLSRQLSPVEQLVLRQSWLGQTYGEMAQNSAYCSAHLKEIGSQLWQELSTKLGQRVTKKNLLLVCNPYSQHSVQKTPDLVSVLKPSASITQTSLVFPSSSISADSPLYINRSPIEEIACAELLQPGCLLRITAPQKMGKSSLVNRLFAWAIAAECKIVSLDFQEADATVFTSLDKLLRWFCVNVSRQLNLNPALNEYWDEEMGNKVSCKLYFESYLLPQINEPIVLSLNEVNRIFEYPSIAQDFLPMLRCWHEQSKTVKIWQKLRLIIVHTTEVYIPLKINQSPFNVGLVIKLPPFNLEQVQELAGRWGLNWSEGREAKQLMAMVGGHPYLVSLAFYYLHRGDMTLEVLLGLAPTAAGIYSHHLRRYWVMLQAEPLLSLALKTVVEAGKGVLLDALVAYKLESAGLIKLEGNLAKPNCELYRLYFSQQLRPETQDLVG